MSPNDFGYVALPALRFIGIDAWKTGEEWTNLWGRVGEFMPRLEQIENCISLEVPYIAALCHHDDGEVDKVNRYLVGHFFKANTPVPDGYDFFDLSPQSVGRTLFENVRGFGEEFWQRYNLTRDSILKDGVSIPYPKGYWHAEVYLDNIPQPEGESADLSCWVLFACNK